MFTFSPYASLRRQRQALLATQSFAPIPLHPAVAAQLQKAKQLDTVPVRPLRSKASLFLSVIVELYQLIAQVVLWNVLNALIVLGAVLVTRYLFQAKGSLTAGLLLSGLFFALKATQAVVEYCSSNSLRQVHRGVQLALYRIVNAKLSRLAPAGRLEFSKGQLKTLVGSDVEAVEDFISAAVMQWPRVIVSSLIVIPVLWFVSGGPGIVALGFVLTLVPVAAIGAAFVERFQVKTQAEQDKLVTALGEWVKNIRLVRFLGWDRAIEAEVNAQMWRFVVQQAIRHSAVLVVWAISYSWWMVPLLAIFALSLSQPEPLNLVEVFASFWLLDHLTSQIQYIPHSLSLYGTAAAGATRIISLLEQPELDQSIRAAPREPIASTAQPVAVALQNVTVRYGSAEVLKNLTITFSLTERTAIIGSVASGKSTLLEVLLGELPFTSGAIEVQFADGARGPLWRHDVYIAFRRAVAYSPQQPFLSNTSMRNNVDLSGNATFEDVQQAVALAQLNDDILLFESGLEEEVGESGINLSGGQKQRVSLARAFISKRTVWLLDDPLSAVDTQTEQRLLRTITDRAQGLIIASHRISAIERCHRVVVLEGGVVVEDGDPQVLAKDSSSHLHRFMQAVEGHGH